MSTFYCVRNTQTGAYLIHSIGYTTRWAKAGHVHGYTTALEAAKMQRAYNWARRNVANEKPIYGDSELVVLNADEAEDHQAKRLADMLTKMIDGVAYDLVNEILMKGNPKEVRYVLSFETDEEPDLKNVGGVKIITKKTDMPKYSTKKFALGVASEKDMVYLRLSFDGLVGAWDIIEFKKVSS
jgi:hypothetical protein